MVSIIIPAYNEERRLFPYLTSIVGYFAARRRACEILVVDDGSHDGTATAVDQYRPQGTAALRLIQLPSNMGKGAAVRTGMLAARGPLRLMADADGATPIQEFESLERAIDGGADIAIGSRALAVHDRRYRVHARWHRSVLGNAFNRFVRCMGIQAITDTQCGFKLFRASIADDLFSVAQVNGYGFDLEVLYIAGRRGYRIAEVPVNWSDRPGSKVQVARDGLTMIRDLIRIRRNEANGHYARRPQPESLDARGSFPGPAEPECSEARLTNTLTFRSS